MRSQLNELSDVMSEGLRTDISKMGSYVVPKGVGELRDGSCLFELEMELFVLRVERRG